MVAWLPVPGPMTRQCVMAEGHGGKAASSWQPGSRKG
jgi:hypothetical protein